MRYPTTRWNSMGRLGSGALGITLLFGGCATARPASVGEPIDALPVRAESVRVDVENTNALDASLYVIDGGGVARRMGDVPGNGAMRSFEVPWTFPVDMAFRIDLVAGGSCVTVPTAVAPGEGIELRIVREFTSVDCR
jgi:hypothetical protein